MVGWSLDYQLEGQRVTLPADGTPSPQNLSRLPHGTLFKRLNDQQIHIAVLVGLAVGIGAELDHLLWLELLDQHAQDDRRRETDDRPSSRLPSSVSFIGRLGSENQGNHLARLLAQQLVVGPYIFQVASWGDRNWLRIR
ncbi:MAG: hypothetical protein AABN34_02925 [Acidobacteriota bacterium]